MTSRMQIFNVIPTSCDDSTRFHIHSFLDRIVHAQFFVLSASGFYRHVTSLHSGWMCFSLSFSSINISSRRLELTSTTFSPISIFLTVSLYILCTSLAPYAFSLLFSLFFYHFSKFFLHFSSTTLLFIFFPSIFFYFFFPFSLFFFFFNPPFFISSDSFLLFSPSHFFFSLSLLILFSLTAHLS